MNKMDLVDHVAAAANLSRAEATAALDAVVGGITKALVRGDDVRLVGFGTFAVKHRKAGMGRNPKTLEAIAIPASRSATFKAGTGLKDSMNKA
ncbi:MAG: HU family DNA-binding protein [Hyphomicrobiales bacterium]|nr:HU family DNA-binding protein [Hyphomicrobiales bacterium]MDE2114051.1 HU family DNA-binding protein [Hyphomicrobiales bacterium]